MRPMLYIKRLDGTMREQPLLVTSCGMPILPTKGDMMRITSHGGGIMYVVIKETCWVYDVDPEIERRVFVHGLEYNHDTNRTFDGEHIHL